MILVAQSLQEFENIKGVGLTHSAFLDGLPLKIVYSCSLIAYKNQDKTYTVLKNRFSDKIGIVSNIDFMCLLDQEKMFDDDEENKIEDHTKTYTVLKNRLDSATRLADYQVWIDDKNYF